MAENPATKQKYTPDDINALKNKFLSHFEGEKLEMTQELLDLARTSYRMRDDDNIHLGMIKSHMLAVLDEGTQRIKNRFPELANKRIPPSEVQKALEDPNHVPKTLKSKKAEEPGFKIRTHQMRGQPASPGIARGKARVIDHHSDLFLIKKGEILVCDVIDPTMTFAVPLCAGIIERRGGMLIHGAIIAREYGLPCVTGVQDATHKIHTGDEVAVDGFLGLVILK
jgi:pyruvate,water dikinase